MIGEQLLATPCIRYDQATREQRGLWRFAMLGERYDLPDWQLDADEQERLAGRVDDERLWDFKARHGFTLYQPRVVVRND